MDPITTSFIIGGAILLLMKGKKKKAVTPPPECGEGEYWDPVTNACVKIKVDPGPGPGPDPDKPPATSKIIGGGWVWPEHDKYPTQMLVAQAIIGLGGYYLGNQWAMGDAVFNFSTDNNAKAGVKEFQRDWNQVATDGAWTILQDPSGKYTGRPVKHLTTDGYIGPNTWKAMLWAFNFRATKGEGAWQSRVTAAKAVN